MNFIDQYLSEDLIYALGWTVLHSLWQALAIALLMMLALLFFQNKSSAFKYKLVSGALLLVLFASVLTFGIYYQQAHEATAFTGPDIETLAQVVPLASAADLHTSGTLSSYIDFFNQNIPFITMVWLLGLCFFLVRLVGGLLYIQRIKHSHHTAVSEYWQQKISALGGKLSLRRPVRLVESSLAAVPMVIGFFKPVVLMPLGAINNLTEAEVEAILAHELAHIRRYDFLINILLSFVEALFYFNPAVWWIAANIRSERENCCDDIAIELCGDSLVYAKALMRLEELELAVPSYAMTMSSSNGELLQRIKRILQQPRTRSNMLEKMLATALLLVSLVLFAFGANTFQYNKNLQKESFAHEMNALLGIHEDNAAYANMLFAKADTTPQKKKQRYIKKSNKGEVELEIIDGDIVRLIIDGEEIPKNELEDYNDLIDQMVEEMEEAQERIPPTPPVPSVLPKPKAPLTPPTPPRLSGKTTQTITTKTTEDGQTKIVILQNCENSPTEIIINDDQQYIYIDGTRLEGGDTAVIIKEGNNSRVAMDDVFSLEILDAEDFRLDLKDLENIDAQNLEAIEQSLAEMEETLKLREEKMQSLLKDMEQRRTEISKRMEMLQKENAEYMEKLRRKMETDAQDHKRRFEEKHKKMRSQRTSRNSHTPTKNCKQKKASPKYPTNSTPRLEYNQRITEAMLAQMLKDELVTDKDNYSFELSPQSFKVNGKIQAGNVLQKYLELYKSLSGHPLHENGQIIFQNKNGNIQSSFRSSGIYDTLPYHLDMLGRAVDLSLAENIENIHDVRLFYITIQLDS